MQIITRIAKIDDLEALYKIENECFDREAFTKSQLAYFLKAQRFVCLVAEMNRNLVGFIIGAVECYEDEICGHVYSLDVSQKYRGKGVASKLLDEMEKIFEMNEAKACYLEVRTDNVAALKLYEKRGYKIMKTLENYYKNGVNGFRLKKVL